MTTLSNIQPIAVLSARSLCAVRKARVLFRQADRNAQPLRQAVGADRAHDHALLQQREVDARAGAIVVADLHQHEVAVRRHVLELPVRRRRRSAAA
jgi:hypothetical protein